MLATSPTRSIQEPPGLRKDVPERRIYIVTLGHRPMCVLHVIKINLGITGITIHVIKLSSLVSQFLNAEKIIVKNTSPHQISPDLTSLVPGEAPAGGQDPFHPVHPAI